MDIVGKILVIVFYSVLQIGKIFLMPQQSYLTSIVEKNGLFIVIISMDHNLVIYVALIPIIGLMMVI
ncbi:hypothetical protein GLOIN_2v1604571 [Rhizophagus irregularis DAOM 181602=DAOM 197198]|uniref:Uncharacterized protein n=1 Tax=Rhizophagus irregularis (strain DAOM 181602 / DAOM 197198 / MUCL 43194) TaxID=747089 RepID=A0A2P4Q1G3_RHIID|nr:hypothetical protein GLOIN_2v1604571 [Rhizophagus irregularis DAOM 181602=DAOM 197198]POG71470.1 hypothetical protein GLOIN_2v1604571 [Rhizophagus irregularis DAOM 181602=DAOM 197198]|eukprot:XP_025178336.1 hypothetical protein GLOIN_2v1604571 [Rhizophagus irregularis DAOM 181602=DAOM 197198]